MLSDPKALAIKLLAMANDTDKNLNAVSINELFNDLLKKVPFDPDVLVRYNEFRVSHAATLPKTRPRIIIGGMSHNSLMSMHTLPLLQIADVVSLTTIKSDIDKKDRIVFDPGIETFSDILKKLPQGFLPDFFWDNQAEGHGIPFGLSEAPFPIIASVCHMYEITTIRSICNIFDAIIPLSRSFIPVLQNFTQKPIFDIPFGLNWGAFVHIPFDGWEKERDVDVSVTFGGSINTVYHDFRSRVRKLITDFREIYKNKYNVILASNLNREQYYELLGRSKISVNVVGIHGPYNYRTNEIMQSGAMLYQLDNSCYSFKTNISDYFENNKHLVTFDFDHFEENLLYFLEHHQERLAIAKQGKDFLEKNYNYHNLYKQLFDFVKDLEPKRNRKNTHSAHPDIHIGASYLYPITQKKDELFVVLPIKHSISLPPYIRNNNLIVSLGVAFKKTKDLRVVLELLKHHQKFYLYFKNDFFQGLLHLFQELPDDPLISWHYLMVAIDCGQPPAFAMFDMIAKLIEIKEFSFDLDLCFFYYNIRPDYLNNNEYELITIQLFQIPLLECYQSDNPKKIFELHRWFMLLHCFRYLVEIEADEAELINHLSCRHIRTNNFNESQNLMSFVIDFPDISKTLKAISLMNRVVQALQNV